MIPNLFSRFGLGKVAHNTAFGMFWQFARIVGQAIWVILIARSLGPSGYGIFAGLAGLATTLGGFVGLGSGWLLLQNVSRDHSAFDSYWRKATLITMVSGLILAALFSTTTHTIAVAHASFITISAIGVSELLCYPLVYLAGFAFQAHERLGWSSSLATMMSGARLLAVVVFWYFALTRDLETYALFHLAASVLSMLCALAITYALLRPKRASFVFTLNELREGLSFSAVWFTGNAVTELDKPLALRLAGSEAAGIYSAAYRLVAALMFPVASLAQAAQPRLFRQSANPDARKPSLVRNLALVAAAYGIAASMALLLLSDFLPMLLGKAFEPAAEAARLLILVPPLFALRLIGNAVLMTSGRQLARVLIEALGILILIGLGYLWVPQYGVAGIAITVTTTEAILAVAIWAILWSSKTPRWSLRSATPFPSKIEETE